MTSGSPAQWMNSVRVCCRFLILCSVLFTLPAHAQEYEYVKAMKVWSVKTGWEGWGQFTEIDQALEQYKKNFCIGNRTACYVTPMEEVFNFGDNQWHLKLKYGFTAVYDSYPDQVFTDQPGAITVFYQCPAGWSKGGQTSKGPCYKAIPPDPQCDTCEASPHEPVPKAGNPIVVSKGIKVQVERDYRSASGTLEFTRTYRSDTGRWAHNYQSVGIDYNHFLNLPKSFCHKDTASLQQYCYPYTSLYKPYNFQVRRGGGQWIKFGTLTDYLPQKWVNDRASPKLNTAGEMTGWTVTNTARGTVETYDLSGLLRSTAGVGGRVTAFTYSDTTTSEDVAPHPGLLTKVTDAFGRSLTFAYDAKGRMVEMRDPANASYAYEYDDYDNLTKVSYPDGASRTYVYNETDKVGPGKATNTLTGIIDENGERFATFRYYGGAAISTEHAGGVDQYTVSYSPSMARVREPLGAVKRYMIVPIAGKLRNRAQYRPGTAGVEVSSWTDYDASGNVVRTKDFNGRITTRAYDLARNLETSRTEGAGSAEARTISTKWHSAHRLPAIIAAPKLITTFEYGQAGNVLSRTEQATTDQTGSAGFAATTLGEPRRWAYRYNQFGQVTRIDGPRTDVDDISAFDYDEQGNLASETDAAGHVTRYSNYDAHGRVGRIVAPNGLVSEFEYGPRGWLIARRVGDEATTFAYDAAGQLISVTMPDGASVSYRYDAAHRLTEIIDSAGNRLQYTLDAAGNRVTEQLTDPSGTLSRQVRRVYNVLNQVKQVTGGEL